ncbi:Calcium-transporting ATPase 1 [Sporomusa ovata DSM 2662]|uniref:ATPase, P-type (Transporting), HAD superfamily, subfamily IC n=1 Tax=Sporomusa ovata TaxID=2378 RepID=A0A0U1L3B0_9FIRM|nr:cation-transporting P-type ATPase [Sporomusa ovata]EQB25255.1 cation transport ATPase [Sporomusa ovata DSM 2662]CQR73819.1 ATPase, P-type (transporting), HAD superfamily, subfamily IC [Sporomusa ovata]
MQLCGLIGLADPPRDSVKQDIETCTEAGVRIVMITGDNGNTASAIAKKLVCLTATKLSPVMSLIK